MNVEIGTEAAQFSEKEYINGIFYMQYFMQLASMLRASSFTAAIKKTAAEQNNSYKFEMKFWSFGVFKAN